jgi:hypothetical protein
MEREGSLPRSQETSTGPYPEPDQSSPYHPILLGPLSRRGASLVCGRRDRPPDMEGSLEYIE